MTSKSKKSKKQVDENMVLCIETAEDGVPFVQLGKYQLRLDLEELEGKYKDRAEKELREFPENVEEGLAKFRELVEAEGNLYVPVDDEKFLIKFLRPFKYNAEHAFKIFKRFYKFKQKHPKYCQNVTPQAVRRVFDTEVFLFLPTRTETGARLMLIHSGTKWNTKEVKLEDMFRATMVGVEIAMLEPKTQLGGVHVIINMEGLSLNHICQFTPALAKLIVDWVQDCAPVRLKGIHIINQPFVFNILYSIFKPFLGEYLKKRLSFHGNDRLSLTKKINPEALPEYLGGTADIPEFPGTLFSDMLFYYEEDFKMYNTYGYVDEDKENDENKSIQN